MHGEHSPGLVFLDRAMDRELQADGRGSVKQRRELAKLNQERNFKTISPVQDQRGRRRAVESQQSQRPTDHLNKNNPYMRSQSGWLAMQAAINFTDAINKAAKKAGKLRKSNTASMSPRRQRNPQGKPEVNLMS